MALRPPPPAQGVLILISKVGYGAILLGAIQRCARVSKEVGVYALVVGAKDETSRPSV